MRHLTEEQIVLHYYGDAEDGPEGSIEQHLRDCSECRGEFQRVQRLLQHIEPTEVPEPPAFFEEKTWLKLRDRLPARRARVWRWLVSPPRWAVAAAVTALLVAAFTAGRFWPRHEGPSTARDNSPGNPRRVVLVAVGDHLERSQMLLVEIMNADAKGPVDLGAEQQQARELLDSNYLYRVSAERVGDPQTARLLDELGRALTEIANSPSEISPRDLQEIQGQIQSDNLLFKVRVVGSEVNSRVRRQEGIPAGNANQRL